MTREAIESEYFRWLYGLVSADYPTEQLSTKKLLTRLHNTEFKCAMLRDENRAKDGVELRWRFAVRMGYRDEYDQLMEILNGPCSVLEMMIALAMRCEETMDDPDVGDRTGQWFWNMIVSLGLGSMSDARYDEEFVDVAIARLLRREYEPNGEGGLFTIRHCDDDLREVEIWRQMWWYMDSIV